MDRAPRRRPGKGGRCSLLALSINRYIKQRPCISLYSHRASSSRAKRLACQVAKALMEALEAGSPLPFAQPPRNRILLKSDEPISKMCFCFTKTLARGRPLDP